MKVSHSLDVISSLRNTINDSTVNDVQIYVGTEKKVFYGSSFLLASRSPIFKSLLFNSDLEQQPKEIELSTISPNNFPSFLDYLSTGEIELTGINVYDMLELSDKYKFEKLNLDCQEYLKKGINIDNCLGMLENGIRLKTEETIKECWRIIDEETDKVLNNPNNLCINGVTMGALLSRNTLTCREIDLFRFLINWGKKQQASSNSPLKEIVNPFLPLIRFPLMNFKELIKEVRPLGVVDDSQYILALEFNAGDKDKPDILNNTQFQSRKKPPPPKDNVDIFIPGPYYALSNHNKTVIRNMGGYWNATCITDVVNKGVHRWSLKIIRSKNSLVGIAPQNINQSEMENYKKCGWYLNLFGNLWSGPPANFNGQNYLGSTIPVGSIIDVELNINKGTIKYFVNGEDKGIAYKGIPTNEPLRLAVLLSNQGDSFELLSHKIY